MARTDPARAAPGTVAPSSPPPGELLRQAREQKKLSIGEVAIKLNLTARTIGDLESGRPPDLPFVYMQGYLRNYARLVGMDEQALADGIGQYGTPGEEWAQRPGADRRRRKGNRKRRVRVLTRLVAAGLCALFVSYWWQERRQVEQPVGATRHVVPSPAVPDADAGPAANAIAGRDRPRPVSRIPEGPPEPGGQADAPGGSADAPVVSGEAAPGGDAGAEEALDAARTAVLPPAPAATTAPNGILSLELLDECWIEIRDASGKLLLAKMGYATDRFSLEGQEPFAILLGNAPAVRLSYNGEPLDVSAYARGNVARFELRGQPEPPETP